MHRCSAAAFRTVATIHEGTIMDQAESLKSLIRDVPDFPKPGITFKDFTPLLRDPSGLALAVELMANPFRGKSVDLVVGAESRGFIFGTALAQALACGFVPVRKPGKLPAKTVKLAYDLEYGSDHVEIHVDSISPGQRVVLVDDLLATGGTMEACCKLVAGLKGQIVGITMLIELGFLNGRRKLDGFGPIHTVLRY
ncbi:MAG: adenine phosphoribosyltransferase [Phycisphaerales bacterium]